MFPPAHQPLGPLQMQIDTIITAVPPLIAKITRKASHGRVEINDLLVQRLVGDSKIHPAFEALRSATAGGKAAETLLGHSDPLIRAIGIALSNATGPERNFSKLQKMGSDADSGVALLAIKTVHAMGFQESSTRQLAAFLLREGLSEGLAQSALEILDQCEIKNLHLARKALSTLATSGVEPVKALAERIYNYARDHGAWNESDPI